MVKRKPGRPKKERVNKRARIGRPLNLDASAYEEKGFQLAYYNDEGGNIDRQMQLGWRPVEAKRSIDSWDVMSGKRKADADKKEYVRVQVRQTRSSPNTWAILMKIPTEQYEEFCQWDVDISNEKKKALKSGANTDTENTDILTYAPELPDGGKGFSETRQ